MRSVVIAGLAVLLAFGAGAPATAQQGGPLAACADPDLDPSTTRNVCRRALEGRLADGQRAAVLVNLGVAEAALGMHRNAIDSFGEAIAIRPDLVQAYSNRARSLIAEGRFDAALEDFDEAVARDPASAEGWLSRGGLLLRLGRYEAATSDLTRAVGLDPDLTAGYFNRGIAYLVTDRPGEAAEDFSTVIARDPQDAGAYLYRGRARGAMGRSDAVADFDRAIELDPEWGRAWYARGIFHDRAGRREAANADFLRAYELGVEDRWLVERVQSIGRN